MYAGQFPHTAYNSSSGEAAAVPSVYPSPTPRMHSHQGVPARHEPGEATQRTESEPPRIRDHPESKQRSRPDTQSYVKLSDTDYLVEGLSLRPSEVVGYKAAGVVPYRIDKERKKIYVLLGVEVRDKGICMHVCGGKREPGETQAWTTALREFNEETLHMLPSEFCTQMWNTSTTSPEFSTGEFGCIAPPDTGLATAWIRPSKYALHFAEVPNTQEVIDISKHHRTKVLEYILRFSKRSSHDCDIESIQLSEEERLRCKQESEVDLIEQLHDLQRGVAENKIEKDLMHHLVWVDLDYLIPPARAEAERQRADKSSGSHTQELKADEPVREAHVRSKRGMRVPLAPSLELPLHFVTANFFASPPVVKYFENIRSAGEHTTSK